MEGQVEVGLKTRADLAVWGARVELAEQETNRTEETELKTSKVVQMEPKTTTSRQKVQG